MSGTPHPGPNYLDEYEAALQTAGIPYDVYNVDATRTAPHWLGVLSHYDGVIWYTGDDVYVRGHRPGPPRRPGDAAAPPARRSCSTTRSSTPAST